jgi:hypothetical protein
LKGARTLVNRLKSLLEERFGFPRDDGKLKRARRQTVQRERPEMSQTGAANEDQSIAGQEPRAPVGGVEKFPAFFIVGRAKSGTSWLRSIMDAHPEILCVNEGRFFGREYRGHGTIPRSLYGALADSEYLTTWVRRSPWSRGEDEEEHVRNLTRHVIDYFMAEKLAKTGKKFAGDKTPLIGMEVVAEIAAIHPDAKVMHIVRDGRDVAISSMHHIWNNARDRGGPNELRPEILSKRDAYQADPEGFLARGESIFVEKQLASTARNWASLVGKAREDGPALLGENYVEVRYEDLLVRPVEETTRLLQFLGADAAEDTVKQCVEVTSFERVSKRKPGEEDSSSFFRKGVAGDWRNVFNEEDKQVFKKVAGNLLIELGYEEDDDW